MTIDLDRDAAAIDAPSSLSDITHGSNARPTIHITAGQIERLTNEAEAALIAADRGVYQRAGRIVTVGEVKTITADAREVSVQRIHEVGEHALTEHLTAAAQWAKWDRQRNEWVSADAPTKVVRALMQRAGRWKLPPLTAVINAPTLRADCSILSEPGYDRATGLLFDPRGTTFPTLREAPTRANAEQAIRYLRGLIGTFPFVGDDDRSVALSTLLTASIRRSLPTAPLHGFTAPVPGSGKTMLVDIASVLATGRQASVMAQGKSEEELEKRLGAMLLAGDPVLAIDNCEAPLGGEFLCTALTSPFVKARILGRSEAPEIPSNALLTATGNNLTLIGDMTRRALLCSLDPKIERPELQVFDTDPIAMVKANRGKYVAAALTILRAFHVAGRPVQSSPLGSFVEWSRWVRDALIWLGEADPVATMELAREADPRHEERVSVFGQWWRVLGRVRVTTRDVIARATDRDDQMRANSDYREPDFREALLIVAGDSGSINSRRLGKWLAANKSRIVGGFQMMQLGFVNGMTTWQLTQAGDALA